MHTLMGTLISVLGSQLLFWRPHCCYGVLTGVTGSLQASHELSNKEQLYEFLLRAPEGTHSGSLRDAYPGVAADMAALQAEGLVWALPNQDTGAPVLYPRERRPPIAITPDVAALWHEVTVIACAAPL
jgi:transcription initiation factor TFIIE subunit beta